MLPVGHVRYVTPDNATSMTTGDLIDGALGDPAGIALAAATVTGLVLFALVMPRLPRWDAFRATLAGGLRDYEVYVPWILRLSTGIMLMGAGVAGYLFVPHLETAARGPLTFLLLAAGFALLVGIMVRAAALLALVVWGYTAGTLGLDALMAAEGVAALLVLTSISAGRPSLDDLMAKTLPSAPRTVRPLGRVRFLLGPEADADVSHMFATWVPVALRVGLGISFLYAGLVEKLLDPGPAVAVATEYGLAVGPLTEARWVFSVALTEMALGAFLILGWAVRPVAALAFVVLTTTLFALPDDPVVAHVSLWGVASAVFVFGAGPWSVDRARLARAVQAEA